MSNHKYNTENNPVPDSATEAILEMAQVRKHRLQNLQPAANFFNTVDLGEGDDSIGNGIDHDEIIKRSHQS